MSCADATNNERQFWDGTDCVAACPLAWDDNRICRTCAELGATKPFWDPVNKKCTDQCPEGQFVNHEETKCVTDCGETVAMTVRKNDKTYNWCTGEQSCPGLGYTDEETDKETCVSVSVCTDIHNRHAYSYGEKKKCLEAAPVDKN